jgi:hypothetical protein
MVVKSQEGVTGGPAVYDELAGMRVSILRPSEEREAKGAVGVRASLSVII